MAIDFEIRTELRDFLQYRTWDFDFSESCTRARDPFSQRFQVVCKRLAERFTISVVFVTTLNDIDTVLKIVFGFNFGV